MHKKVVKESESQHHKTWSSHVRREYEGKYINLIIISHNTCRWTTTTRESLSRHYEWMKRDTSRHQPLYMFIIIIISKSHNLEDSQKNLVTYLISQLTLIAWTIIVCKTTFHDCDHFDEFSVTRRMLLLEINHSRLFICLMQCFIKCAAVKAAHSRGLNVQY